MKTPHKVQLTWEFNCVTVTCTYSTFAESHKGGASSVNRGASMQALRKNYIGWLFDFVSTVYHSLAQCSGIDIAAWCSWSDQGRRRFHVFYENSLVAGSSSELLGCNDNTCL